MSDTRIVMEITEISSSRVRILLDDGTGFVLYKGERRNYNLREGEQIGTEDYAEIMETVLPKRAKLRALNLLKARSYTQKALADKLRDGGYPEKILEREQILFWMRKKNFIASEATFAEKQKFCAFLYRKGFQIDAIQTALSLDIESI